MLGDGLIQVRPVASNSSPRFQPSHLIDLQIDGQLSLGVEHAGPARRRSCRAARRSGASRRTIPCPRRASGRRRRRRRSDWAGRARRTACSCSAGGLHGLAHRGDVRVEPRADVLDVEHERVDVAELLAGGPPRCAVEAVDRQAGRRVAAVADPSRSSLPAMPCSGLNRATSRTPCGRSQ